MNPLTAEYLAREKQRMFLEEAKIYNLRKMAKESRPNISERVLPNIGNFMISGGYWLIKKYSPVFHANVEVEATTISGYFKL